MTVTIYVIHMKINRFSLRFVSCSWIVGVGSGYSAFLWHKMSYNNPLEYPLKGRIYAGIQAPKTSGITQNLPTVEAAQLDFQGEASTHYIIMYTMHSRYGCPRC